MNLRNPSTFLAWVFVAFAPLLQAQELDTGLVAYFPFSGNANDESGNNNDGKAIGPVPARDRYGNQGSAFRFDGRDDRIEVPDSQTLNLRQELSLTAWIFALSRKSQVVLMKGSTLTGTQAAPYGISLSQTGDVVFSVRSGQATTQARVSGYPLGRWFAVTGTFAQGSLNLYIDGKQVVTQSAEITTLGANRQPLLIGTRLGLESSTFDGIIDDIRIYNRALDAAEVSNLYDLEAPNRPPQAEAAVGTALATSNPNTPGEEFAFNLRWEEVENGNRIITGNIAFPPGTITNPPTGGFRVNQIPGSSLVVRFQGSEFLYPDPSIIFSADSQVNFSTELIEQITDFNVFTNEFTGIDPNLLRDSDGVRYNLVSMRPGVSGQLIAADPDNDAILTYNLDTPALGLSVNPDGSYTFDNSHPAYASLPEGETSQVIANWTVTDENGTSDSSTLTITVRGTNDPPVAQPAFAPVNGRGELSAVDPDGDLLVFSLNQQIPGLVLSENGSYTFNPSHPAYRSIPAGQTDQVIANWTVTDDKGASDSSTLTITVTGENDPPVAQATFAPGNGRGELIASDPDRNNSLSYSLDSEIFGLYLDEDGSYIFDSSHPFYIPIPEGETLQIVANWTVTDDKGASDSSTLTITVTGENDPPVAQPAFAPDNGRGELPASDPDRDASLSFTLESQVPGLLLSESGNYTFDNSHPAYASIPEGGTLQIVAAWTVTDDKGATDSSTLTITVTGTNDPPIAQSSSATDPQSGVLSATDPDGDPLTFSLGQQVPGFAVSESGSYTFNPSHPAYISIPEGQTGQVIANWTVTDDKGASDTGTLTITVTGANDPPVAAPAFAPDNGRGELTASDPDRNTNLVFTLDSEIFGLYLDEDGSFIFDSSHPFYIPIPDGETNQVIANWTVTDERGASDSSTLTITVRGRNDPPIAQLAFAPENGRGELSAVDPDGDPLVYRLDQQVPGLSLSESGSYTFNPSHSAYISIPEGETGQVIANWTVIDDKGATDSSTLTITVKGANDPPVAQSAFAPDNGRGQLPANDPDRNATLSFTLNSQVPGLLLSESGNYTFDSSHPAYASLPEGETLQVIANWTVTDDKGASDSSTLTITVRGTNDPPVAQPAFAPANGRGELSAVDPDGDLLVFSLNQQVPGLVLSESGSYTFNPSHPAYRSIPADQTDQVIANWTVTDDKGASGSSTLTITVMGENDPPVAQPAFAPDNGSGELPASDPDRNATLSFTLNSQIPGLLLSESGSYTFNSSHPAYASLPEGETLQVIANWTVTDDKGASDSSTLTITVRGTNDAPVAVAAISDGSTPPELSSQRATFKLKWKHERNPTRTLTGTISFPADTITNKPNIDFESVPGSNLIIRSGEQTFNYPEPVVYFTADTQIDFSRELVGQITDFNIFTSRFLGWGPSILEGRDGLYSLVSMIVCPSGRLEANDPDNGATLTYSLDSPVAGLLLNPDGTYSFDPFDPAYAWIPSGTTVDVVANWTVIDEEGASDSSTLTITVTGTNDFVVGLIALATAPSHTEAPSVAPHSPRILDVSASNSSQGVRSVAVTFSSRPGEVYSIQRSRDLAQWSNLAEILSEEESTTFTDSDPILDGDPVFYRAKMANP